MRILSLTVLSALLFAGAVPLSVVADDIGIDERLGEYLPLELGFVDADGDSAYLRDIVNKPTVLSLVYYHCPSICKPLLGAVADLVDKTDLDPGRDYDLLTISFDEDDTPESARGIRTNFVSSLDREIPDGAWRFLVADSTTIAALTDAAGFRFRRQEKDFAHGSCLIVLSADGKIARYLYGLSFMPFDLKMAVSEARQGKTAPSIARVLQYCFSYDPEGRRYVFNVTRVAGTGILLFAIAWIFYSTTVGRSRRRRVQGREEVKG